MSFMREAMWSQPGELARVHNDPGPARAAAERLRGRRIHLIGVGTSWHAAHHGVWLLREGGVTACASHAGDLAPYGWPIAADDGVIVLSHGGGTGYTAQMLARAREAGAAVVHITGIGAGGDVETVAPERSYAYTVSHTVALLRLAQIATALGAHLGDMGLVADEVSRVLELPGSLTPVPGRLIEIVGAGPNAWTAQEGALKIREASYIAAEGLSSEQFFHGPSVALDDQDTLVVLDAGGPAAARTDSIARAMEVTGARVVRFAERRLGEPLSIFALTTVVQRIALEFAEARCVSPDRFRYEQDPRREQAFESVGF